MSDTSQFTKAIKFCTELPAFRSLDDGQCKQLLQIARERAFAPDETVIQQGDRSEQLWILLEGKCEVIRRSEGSQSSDQDGSLILAGLEPYNVFGEMSFFSPAPHSASVVARTHVRLLSIARRDYDELLAAGNLAAYKLAYNVTASLASRLRRMDDWVAELTSKHDPDCDQADAKVPEWTEFRKKVFESWNL